MRIEGKGEAALREGIRELEREVRLRTGALYSEALRTGDWEGAARKALELREQVEKLLGEPEKLALDAVES